MSSVQQRQQETKKRRAEEQENKTKKWKTKLGKDGQMRIQTEHGKTWQLACTVCCTNNRLSIARYPDGSETKNVLCLEHSKLNGTYISKKQCEKCVEEKAINPGSSNHPNKEGQFKLCTKHAKKAGTWKRWPKKYCKECLRRKVDQPDTGAFPDATGKKKQLCSKHAEALGCYTVSQPCRQCLDDGELDPQTASFKDEDGKFAFCKKHQKDTTIIYRPCTTCVEKEMKPYKQRRFPDKDGKNMLCHGHAVEAGTICKTARLGGSHKACAFFDFINQKLNMTIQHVHFIPGKVLPEGRETVIPTTLFRPDGRITDSPYVLYEYLGVCWHGYPRDHPHYISNKFLTTIKKTVREAYNKTMERFYKIHKLGYTIYYIWSDEGDLAIKNKVPLEKVIRKFTIDDLVSIPVLPDLDKTIIDNGDEDEEYQQADGKPLQEDVSDDEEENDDDENNSETDESEQKSSSSKTKHPKRKRDEQKSDSTSDEEEEKDRPKKDDNSSSSDSNEDEEDDDDMTDDTPKPIPKLRTVFKQNKKHIPILFPLRQKLKQLNLPKRIKKQPQSSSSSSSSLFPPPPVPTLIIECECIDYIETKLNKKINHRHFPNKKDIKQSAGRCFSNFPSTMPPLPTLANCLPKVSVTGQCAISSNILFEFLYTGQSGYPLEDSRSVLRNNFELHDVAMKRLKVIQKSNNYLLFYIFQSDWEKIKSNTMLLCDALHMLEQS